jgi:hypothetical protein
MEFKRENRYIVIKLSDIGLIPKKFDPDFMREYWKDQGKNMAYWRKEAGKSPLECVVVESDWPEYEPTRDAIQRRMEGRPTREAELLSLISELKEELTRCCG